MRLSASPARARDAGDVTPAPAVVLETRVVTGSGGGPDKTILYSPRFLARGAGSEILEFPPATLRVLGTNLPVGGGGYFRLLPPALLRRALDQVRRDCRPAVATLYFHPWEFDPDQPRLPLRRLSRFRTYVGVAHNRARLEALLARHRFTRAVDVARRLDGHRRDLPSFRLAK